MHPTARVVNEVFGTAAENGAASSQQLPGTRAGPAGGCGSSGGDGGPRLARGAPPALCSLSCRNDRAAPSCAETAWPHPRAAAGLLQMQPFSSNSGVRITLIPQENLPDFQANAGRDSQGPSAGQPRCSHPRRCGGRCRAAACAASSRTAPRRHRRAVNPNAPAGRECAELRLPQGAAAQAAPPLPLPRCVPGPRGGARVTESRNRLVGRDREEHRVQPFPLHGHGP